MYCKTNENKFSKQAKMQQTSRHGVQLKNGQVEQDTSGRKKITAVDEANRICTLTVRPAHCHTAAKYVKSGTTYKDKSCVTSVTWAW